jgi:hypothetical protein
MAAEDYFDTCTTAPHYIPQRALSQEDPTALNLLNAARVGAATDLIHARKVLANPFPDIAIFKSKDFPLTLVDIGVYIDYSCYVSYCNKISKRGKKTRAFTLRLLTLQEES